MTQSIPTVHMIGNAHLDPVWLWTWTEGRAEALATCYAAVQILKEYPDVHFTRGEAHIYRWVAEEDPALLEEIRGFIAAGRWHVVNGMVIQPDMNLPQGESFVRQALLGKRYLRELLGAEAIPIAYCVDSFGHAGTLPQIFRQCGYDSYVFMRPGPHEKELPAEVFWWEGPDGSRVLAYRIPHPYATRFVEHEEHIGKALAAKPAALAHTMSFFGVGNHGGGPTRAQVENIQAIAARRTDAAIRFSHPQAYFDAIAADAARLPTVRDELQFHAVGCYSVISPLKQLHRQAENALLVAERMAALAHLWAGQAIPRAQLHDLWWDTLFNQFHDTLGGSSIKTGEDEAIMALSRTVIGAREIANDAGRAVAQQVDTRGPGSTVVIFNPAAQAARQVVEYEPWTEWELWDAGGWGLVDDTGQPVPHQVVEPDSAVNRADRGINRLVFPADVPPLGYRVYRFAPGLPRRSVASTVHADATTLENEYWRLTLDADTGHIASCVDKATGAELAGAAGWNVAQVIHDESDTWSHRVTDYGEPTGHFASPTVQVYETGPLQASLLVRRTYEQSEWLQQIIVRQNDPAILIRNWLHWHGQMQTLKLAFALATDAPRAFHDVPFGALERPCNGQEFPAQMWLAVAGPLQPNGQAAGVALLNDGKYGCDVSGPALRLTVLRSPPYAFHDPHPFGLKQRYDWVDQGLQTFTLALRPFMGDWRDTDIVAQARALNQPLVPITMHAHPGHRPPHASLLHLDAHELELTALKAAEDGAGFIVRVADKHGRGGSGNVAWQGQAFSVALKPYQALTWRLTQEGGRWQMTPCDMIEQPV